MSSHFLLEMQLIMQIQSQNIFVNIFVKCLTVIRHNITIKYYANGVVAKSEPLCIGELRRRASKFERLGTCKDFEVFNFFSATISNFEAC